MPIRDYFTSRFPNGYMVEVDYSQLEIYVLAFLSGDPVLKDDLLSGKDLHSMNAALLFGPDFTDKDRRNAKRMSFQLQYGAGAASMSVKLGLPKKTCQQFIDNYYNRYKRVKTYQDSNVSDAQTSRQPSEQRTKKGKPAGQYVMASHTGRRYVFVEEDAPEWLRSKTVTFSPTTLKNYPVQGLATGDIVPAMLGVLYKKLKADNLEALMVNTVHDSIMFDCPNSELHTLMALIHSVLKDTHEWVSRLYAFDFNLKLPFDAEYGPNLGNMEKYNLTRFAS